MYLRPAGADFGPVPRKRVHGGAYGTVTVSTDSGPVEVTPFRREGSYADGRHPDRVSFEASLEEDLARRDFTVNAMALDEKGNIVDLFGGRADLERGLIRCVGNPEARFREDALRMFRGVRFAASWDLTWRGRRLKRSGAARPLPPGWPPSGWDRRWSAPCSPHGPAWREGFSSSD